MMNIISEYMALHICLFACLCVYLHIFVLLFLCIYVGICSLDMFL